MVIFINSMKLKFLYLVFLQYLLFSCTQPAYKNPHVIIETNFGKIEIELFPDKAVNIIDTTYQKHNK